LVVRHDPGTARLSRFGSKGVGPAVQGVRTGRTDAKPAGPRL